MGSACRFVLANVKEGELQEEYGYDIFEPRLGLELGGKNAFQTFGIAGVDNVIIMVFRHGAILQTLGILTELGSMSEGQYEYWLMGTAYGIILHRQKDNLQVSVKVDGKMGPVHENVRWPHTVDVGRCTVQEWGEAVALLAKELSNLLRTHNPRIYALPYVQEEETKLAKLNVWLESSLRESGSDDGLSAPSSL